MVDKDEREERELKEFMAARIKQAMSDHPLNAEKLAEAVGVSKAAASKWPRTGNISHYRLRRLSQVTGRPVGWFYPGFEEGDQESSMESLLESASADTEVLEEILFRALAARRRSSNSK